MADSVKPHTPSARLYHVREAMSRKPLREVVRENAVRLKDDRGDSEQKLARRGLSQRTINRALHGSNLTLDKLDELAHSLGLEAWQLCVPSLDLARVASSAPVDERPGRAASELYSRYRAADPASRQAIDALLSRVPGAAAVRKTRGSM